MKKRALALLLSFSMAWSLLPSPALAAGTNDSTEPTILEETDPAVDQKAEPAVGEKTEPAVNEEADSVTSQETNPESVYTISQVIQGPIFSWDDKYPSISTHGLDSNDERWNTKQEFSGVYEGYKAQLDSASKSVYEDMLKNFQTLVTNSSTNFPQTASNTVTLQIKLDLPSDAPTPRGKVENREIILDTDSETEINEWASTTIFSAYLALQRDHPEMSWLVAGQYGFNYALSGTSTADGSIDISISSLTFSLYYVPKEFLTTAQLPNQTIIDSINEKKTVYDKLLTIHDELCKRITYGFDDRDNNGTGINVPFDQSAYSALVTGKTVCAGYTSAFKLLCDMVGIPCVYVSGHSAQKADGSSGGEAHAWNLVQIGTQWYAVDATWDDQTSQTYHDFFLVGANTTAPDHWTNVKGMKFTESHLSLMDWIGSPGVSYPALSATSYVDSTIAPASGTVTYGDNFTVAVSNIRDSATPLNILKTGTVGLYLGETKLAEQTVSSEETNLSFTADKKLTINKATTLTVKYTGNGHTDTVLGTVDVTMEQKLLTAAFAESATKQYDGTTDFTGIALNLTGTIANDQVIATARGTTSNANVGEYEAATVTVALAGSDAQYYAAPTTVTGKLTIVPLTPELTMTANPNTVSVGDKVALTVTLGNAKGTTLPTANDFTFTAAHNGTTETINPISTSSSTTEGTYTFEYSIPSGWTGKVTFSAKLQATTNYTATTESATCTVTISNQQMRTFTASAGESTLTVGGTTRISVSDNATDKPQNYQYTYGSNNETVATVSEDGTITALAKGKATITVTAPATDTFNAAIAIVEITVNPKTITITGATVSDRAYDGTNNASVTAVTFSDSNLATTDYEATAAFADANAGTGKPVTVTVTLTDKGQEKYTFAQNNPTAKYTSATATISPAERHITAEASKNPLTVGETATITITDNANAEHPVYTYSSDNSNIVTVDTNGTITSVSSGSTTIKVQAAATTNYEAGTAQISIQVASKTLTASVKIKDKPYDATTSAEIESVTFDDATANTWVRGTDYTISAEFETANAGEHNVKVTITLLTDALKNAYAINPITAKATISKADPDVGTVTANPETVFDTTAVSDVKLQHTGTANGTLTLNENKFTFGTNTYHWTFTPTDTTNYNTKTGEIQITVKQNTLSSIAVTNTPTKTSYVYGEKFDPSGLTITATYAGGQTTNIPVADASYSDLGDVGSNKTVTVTYQGKTATVSGITVTPKVLDVSSIQWTGGPTFTYDGTVKTVTLNGATPDELEVSLTGNSATIAGVYTATATWTVKSGLTAGNYTITGSPKEYPWEIDKATLPSTPKSVSLEYNVTASQTLTATDFGFAVPGTFTVGTITGDDILAATPTDGTTVSFALKSGLAMTDRGKSATISLTFQPSDTANYNTTSVTLTIRVSSKDVPSIKAENLNRVYNGKFNIDELKPTATFNNAAVEGTWSFVEATNPVTTNGNATNAAYTLQFTPKDTNKYETVTTNVTIKITPMLITLTARDDTIRTNETIPTLTYTVFPALLAGDSLPTSSISLSCSADTSQIGTAAIVITGPEYSSDGNYQFNYRNGTLTIQGPGPISVTGVSLSQNALSLTKGQSSTLTCEVSPAKADNQAVTWTSSNPGVANLRIINDGKNVMVSAEHGGSATITVRTADGGYTATCNVTVTEDITPNTKIELPNPPPAGSEVKLEMGGLNEVPSDLQNDPSYNTVEKIETALENEIIQNNTSISRNNIHVYDVSLMIVNTTTNEKTPVAPNNFPFGGLTVVLPYPTGTNQSGYKFTVTHLTASGVMETINNVTNTFYGIQFTLYSLSPIAVGWTNVQENTPPTPTPTPTPSNPVPSYVPQTPTTTVRRPTSQASSTAETPSATPTPTSKPLAPDKALPFADIAKGDWYADAVSFVYTHGIMNGIDDKNFAPKAETTRAMLVTMLYRLEGEPKASAADFADVRTDWWYTDAIGWAAANGIVNGYGNGNFGPEDTLTREQVATILYRYAKLKGYDTSASQDLSGYTDKDSISDYALEAMAWANAAGLITGVTQTTLAPSGSAERAQIATIFMRYCKNIATDLV